MRLRTYRYNTVTCQYERARVNARSVAWYSLGLTVMASCMLLGILLLHDLLINTANENRLRKENRALRRHHTLLSDELNALQPVLTTLQNKDRILHNKIFGAQPLPPPPDQDRASKEKLLLADERSFPRQVSSLKSTSGQLLVQASRTNHYFGNKVRLNDDVVLAKIESLPTLQPVRPLPPDRLISGFGLRVNPFHKGKYEHLGVDIAMPRGTPVVATGTGTVVQLKRSDLQAGYGNYIEVDHGHGLITRYAHLEEIEVRFGAKVRKGDIIGTIGTSGGSVAPHLHYEILHHGKNIDPVDYMVDGLTSGEYHRLAAISHRQNQSLD